MKVFNVILQYVLTVHSIIRNTELSTGFSSIQILSKFLNNHGEELVSETFQTGIRLLFGEKKKKSVNNPMQRQRIQRSAVAQTVRDFCMYEVGLFDKYSGKQTAEMRQEAERPSFEHIFLMFQMSFSSMLMIKGDLKFIFNFNKDIFPTFPFLHHYSYSTATLKGLLGERICKIFIGAQRELNIYSIK